MNSRFGGGVAILSDNFKGHKSCDFKASLRWHSLNAKI